MKGESERDRKEGRENRDGKICNESHRERDSQIEMETERERERERERVCV